MSSRAKDKTPDYVMLSEAKDLLFFVFEGKHQMLRSGQHDIWLFLAAYRLGYYYEVLGLAS